MWRRLMKTPPVYGENRPQFVIKPKYRRSYCDNIVVAARPILQHKHKLRNASAHSAGIFRALSEPVAHRKYRLSRTGLTSPPSGFHAKGCHKLLVSGPLLPGPCMRGCRHSQRHRSRVWSTEKALQDRNATNHSPSKPLENEAIYTSLR